MVALLLPLLAVFSDYQNRELKGQSIALNSVGEGKKEVVLELEAEGVLEEEEIVLELGERRRTREETVALLQQAEAEMEKSFFAEGEGADGVTSAVFPKESYCKGTVKADFRFENYHYLDAFGQRTKEEVPQAGVPIKVFVTFSCGEEKLEDSFVIRILPEKKSEEEKLLESTLITIKLQEEAPGQENITLPEETGGVKLHWKEKKPHTALKIILLELLVAVLAPLLRKERKQKERENREKSLLLAYPSLVNKLSILVGCGMPIKQSWYKISAQNTYAEQSGAKMLQEEMQITARELESGVSERQAYEEFASRMQVQPYYRLSRILIQDLEKGGGGLKEQLRLEAVAAFKERTLLAKKLGEEAQTKMLGPLIMMMGIVMVIVVSPAIIEFTI